MDAAHVDAEQRVGPVRPGQAGRIRKVEVDDEYGEQREEAVEAEVAEAQVRVPGVDGAVVVAVPEEDVLLQDGLERRRQGPSFPSASRLVTKTASKKTEPALHSP